MLPIRDSEPSERTPFVNYAIIAATILIFLLQLAVPDFEQFVYQYGFVPLRFDLSHPATYLPIFYSIWLHGGFFHIASNLWFLHIFGDNVESRLGHVRYLLFYIFTGVIGVLAQYALDIDSQIPMIGASGAISGVAGAYFVFFKHARIQALVPIYFFIRIIELPSWFFLGYWFFIQVFSGIGSLTVFTQGGVAYFAHIGGFVTGYLIAKATKKREEKHRSDYQEVYYV